jgi:hypothetical protein
MSVNEHKKGGRRPLFRHYGKRYPDEQRYQRANGKQFLPRASDDGYRIVGMLEIKPARPGARSAGLMR